MVSVHNGFSAPETMLRMPILKWPVHFTMSVNQHLFGYVWLVSRIWCISLISQPRTFIFQMPFRLTTCWVLHLVISYFMVRVLFFLFQIFCGFRYWVEPWWVPKLIKRNVHFAWSRWIWQIKNWSLVNVDMRWKPIAWVSSWCA
jgi:hypothetical protein